MKCCGGYGFYVMFYSLRSHSAHLIIMLATLNPPAGHDFGRKTFIFNSVKICMVVYFLLISR